MRMKPSFYHKFGSALMSLSVLLAYFLMSSGPLAGLVLCFGTDSHLKVETAHARGLDNQPASHQGPCLDIPLTGLWSASHHSALSADSKLLSQMREPIPLPPSNLPTASTGNASQLVFQRREAISTSLPPLFRSTILLI
jgi:hypothetical protein